MTSRRRRGPGATRVRNKCVIHVDTDEHRVLDEAVRALDGSTEVWDFEGRLVELGRRGRLRMHEVTPVRLRDILTRRARFIRNRKKPIHPPEWLVRGVLERQDRPEIRKLQGLSPGPFTRPDGSACTQPGYDEATGIYCAHHGLDLAVPTRPSRAEALDALEVLLRPVAEFPFGTDAARSVYLALVLTVFARFAHDGLTPMFVIDGNAPGVGKTKLVDLVGLMATGEEPPHMSELRNEEEMRKRITSLVLDGSTFAFLDNIAGTLGGPCLDNALTSRFWTDRVLGGNRMVEARNRLIWVATGNNIAIRGDLARRLLICRLVSRREAPEERDGFDIGDLRHYVLERRGDLVTAALTILAAHARAERPSGDMVQMGSFEKWSAVVRGAIVWLDQPDPAETRSGLRDQLDDERSSRRELMAALEAFAGNATGFTARELVHEVEARPRSALAEALREACGLRPLDSPTAVGVGRVLRGLRDQVADGLMLQSLKKTKHGQRWKVVRPGDAGDGGDADRPPGPIDSAGPVDRHHRHPRHPEEARHEG